MNDKKFLIHIAGLRGIAILLVVLYHLMQHEPGLGLPWLSVRDGYFGVDIFLVIMGYFLLRGFAHKDGVSCLSFAGGKFRRIMLPQACVVALALVAGLFILDSDYLSMAAQTGLASLAGVANIFLYQKSVDYFNGDGALNPFFHLWYLSVALQLFALFYLGYRLARKMPGKLVMVLLLGGGCMSLLYSELPHLNPVLMQVGLPPFVSSEVSYFSTPARVWEVLAGGLPLILPEIQGKAKRWAVAALGLCLILVPPLVIFIGSSAGIPLVVAGTVLLIRYAPATPLMSLLGCKPLLWLGNISFSLYLLHVPILIGYRGWTGRQPDAGMVLVLFACSLLAAYLFWIGMEKKRFPMYVGVVTWGGAILLCAWGVASDGFRNLIHQESGQFREPVYREWNMCTDAAVAKGLDIKHFPAWHRWQGEGGHYVEVPSRLLTLGEASTQPKYVLMGDSHALSLFAGMDVLAKEMGTSGLFLDSIILPFWDRYGRRGSNYIYYREKAEGLLAWLQAHPELETVFLANYWSLWVGKMTKDWNLCPLECSYEADVASMREFCGQLKGIGKKVVIFTAVPTLQAPSSLHVFDPVFYHHWLARHGKSVETEGDFFCTRSLYEAENGRMVKALEQMEADGLCTVLHPERYLLQGGQCTALQEGQVIYLDSNHLNATGSIQVMRALRPEMEKILCPAPSAAGTQPSTCPQ